MVLSIIIPTYNRRDLIKYTLDSVAPGHHRNIVFEVIVVDDGSTDGTGDFITQHYPEVILLTISNSGGGVARNAGLNVAKGKFVMYLDSDDLVGENYFDKKVDLLQQQPELDACYGQYEYFESNAELNNIVFKHKYQPIFSAEKTKEHLVNYLGGNFLPQNSIIWRKEFLVKIKGHDAALAINQDVELFIRGIFNGMKIAAIQDDTKVYIRTHTLDKRVGDPKTAGHKWLQILELRKKVFKDLAEYGFDDADYYRAMSKYLFGYWKILRHTAPDIAQHYLDFAKQVHWPVEIQGNVVYRIMAKMLGPVQVVKMKYLLLKRD